MIDFDDFNELLNKFDRIHDLPISEETLGAYLDGTLDEASAIGIEPLIDGDSNLSAIVDDFAREDFNSGISSDDSHFNSIPPVDSIFNSISFPGREIENLPDLSDFELPKIAPTNPAEIFPAGNLIDFDDSASLNINTPSGDNDIFNNLDF